MSQFTRILEVCLSAAALLAPAYSQSTTTGTDTRTTPLLERIRKLEERIVALEGREPPVSTPDLAAASTPASTSDSASLLKGTHST